jgi:hypothetical protein
MLTKKVNIAALSSKYLKDRQRVIEPVLNKLGYKLRFNETKKGPISSITSIIVSFYIQNKSNNELLKGDLDEFNTFMGKVNKIKREKLRSKTPGVYLRAYYVGTKNGVIETFILNEKSFIEYNIYLLKDHLVSYETNIK